MRRESYLSQPSQLEIYQVFSGMDIILRKNIELVEREEIQDGKKSKYKVWECDEIQFHYQGKVTQEEIESDFDYWYAKAEEVPDASSVEDLSLEDARKAKYQEIAKACEQTIYAGVDVPTSSGVEHFSLTEKDQLNLFGKKMQLLAGEEKLEYHEDGHPCKYFSAADMQNIVDRAMFFVSYNTTYCKHHTLEGCDLLTEKQLQKLQGSMDQFGYDRSPYPSWALQNNLANIKRCQQRVDELKKTKEKGTYEADYGDFKVIENTELMRIQIVFDGKPDEAIRSTLKSNGFRWAPSHGAWQRQLTSNGKYALRKVIEELGAEVQAS